MRGRNVFAVAVAAVAVLVGCSERGSAPASGDKVASDARGATPTTNEPQVAVPPPTRVDTTSSRDMRYFYWEPAVSVVGAGTDARARAEGVLASATVRTLLGAADGDGFVFQKHDEKRRMFTFRQTLAFRGQAVIVADAYATVELDPGGTGLVYIGTGFRPGISLTDAALTVDEAQAETVAVAAYEGQEKAKGKATPHLDQGLRVQRVRGKGDRLVYAIHVERAAGEGHSRPFMFHVDAQSGEVLDQYQAWIE